jgi:HK97 family phage major capsid protein
MNEPTIAEVKSAIEGVNTAFEQFKQANDKRLAAIEAGKGDSSDLKVQMQKAFNEMAETKSILSALEIKVNRPQIMGANGQPISPDVKAHADAVGLYLRKGVEYDRILEQKALNIGAGTDGGFAVPKEIDSMIDAIAVNISPIRQIAKVVQIGTSDYHKLINIRGTTSGWVGETTSRTETSTPQLVDIQPPMGELYAAPRATQQMLDDVFFNAESWLAGEVGTEFARAEGAAFVSGTGVVQPKGFTSYTTAATADASRAFGTLEHVATGASGAFKTLTSTVNPADDLYLLVSKMKAAYRTGSRWVLNKATLFQIMGFKDYQGRYVFNPTSAPGVADTILGYPVTEAEDMPTYSTASALGLAFGNFQMGYLIVDRIGTRVIRDPYTTKPYIIFYTTKRVGGAVTNSETIKFLKFA